MVLGPLPIDRYTTTGRAIYTCTYIVLSMRVKLLSYNS